MPTPPAPVAPPAAPTPAPLPQSPTPPQPPPAPTAANPSDINSGPGKKRLILIAVAVVFLIAAAFIAFKLFTSRSGNSGPTGGQPSADKPVTLEYWGLWEPSSVTEQVFADFQTQNPGITVNYTQQSIQDYRQRLQSALASGSGPDIYRFHNTWVPMLKKELAPIPSTIISPAEFESTFYPVAVSDLKDQSSFLGVPLMFDGLGLYYNKTVFTKAGATPPTTWDGLRKTAKTLTIRTNNKLERGGIALGLTENIDHFSDIVALMLLQNGADPANPTNSLAENTLTYYRIFATSDQVWDETLPPSTFAVATEKAAMMIAPSWRAHEVAAINPDLDFAIAPLPTLPDGDQSWASYWVEGVSSSSQNQQASWLLLKYLSQPDTLRQLYTAASNERLFGEPFSRRDMADQLVGDQYVGAYISQAEKAVSWPLTSSTFDNGLNDRIVKYYQDALNAGAGESALTTAAQGIVQVLSQYGASPK